MPLDDLPPLYRTSAHGPGSPESAALRRGTARGDLVRLHAGVFVVAAAWEGLDAGQRQRLRVRAVVPRLADRVVVSHESAAALLGLPLPRTELAEVHVTDPDRSGGRRRPGLVTHTGPLADSSVGEADGFRVTTATRTGVDIALRGRLRGSVPLLDAALRAGLVTQEGMLAELDETGRVHGVAAARRAIDFADGRAQLPGESLTRVFLREVNAPPPLLQQPFFDDRGKIGEVDFWFPDQGVVLEFDGDIKYTEARYRGGLTPAQVVVKERKRERRLLRLPEIRDVVRTDWAELLGRRRLADALAAAGVPLTRV